MDGAIIRKELNDVKALNDRSITYLGIFLFIIGTIISFFSILYMATVQLSLSDLEEFQEIVTIMGIGVPLIFTGINVYLRSEIKYVNLSIAPQTLLCIAPVMFFYISFPESLQYPSIGYSVLFYSIGILMLIGNIYNHIGNSADQIYGKENSKKTFNVNEDLKPIQYWAHEEHNKIGEIIQSEISTLIVKGEEFRADLKKEKRKAKSDLKKLLLSSLEIVDTFNFLFKKIEPKRSAVDKQTKIWLGNFQAIKRLAERVLSEAGVTEIETPNGKAIPGLHTIITTEKNSDLEDYIIVEELEKGYLWQREVLRKSSVIVVKNSD